MEVTQGSLAGARKPNDPCGRLGPYLDAGDPDYRNMQRYYVNVREGDTVLCVTDPIVRNHESLRLPSVSSLQTRVDNLIESTLDATEEMRNFLTLNPSAVAPKDMKVYLFSLSRLCLTQFLQGFLDHSSCLAVLVGRPTLLSKFTWVGVPNANYGESEGGDVVEWNSVFVLGVRDVQLEVQHQMMLCKVCDYSESVSPIHRVKQIGCIPLTEQLSRKNLCRWLSKCLSNNGHPDKGGAAQEFFSKELVPERDTLHVMAKGRSAEVAGCVVEDVVIDVYGHNNQLLTQQRLIVGKFDEPSRLQELTRGPRFANCVAVPSFHDWLMSIERK